MFFLIRCAFWLGLVFSAMEWPADTPKLPTATQAVAQVAALPLAAQAASQVVTGARKVCVRNPHACLEAADLASDLVRNEGKPAVKAAGRGNDTLAAADKAPAWRGRN